MLVLYTLFCVIKSWYLYLVQKYGHNNLGENYGLQTTTRINQSPLRIINDKKQEEQQSNESMVFISFAYWTRVKLLFVNIKPILRGLRDDTPESTELFLKLKQPNTIGYLLTCPTVWTKEWLRNYRKLFPAPSVECL